LSKPQYSGDVAAALALAATLHRGQVRKGTSIPYLAHLLGVAAIVWEHGGDEEQAIAGLLHDAVEDQGGAPTLETIQRGFGERVAGIVDACTDADTVPKPPWRERKERYVAHIDQVREDALIVSMADKLHNVRAILADYLILGDGVWERFSAGKTEVLWYYRALVVAFRKRTSSLLLDRLDAAVTELEDAVRA
jgi:GTP pyrophosphokinase